MKNDDDGMDERLRAALRAEDAELLARLEQDPGLREVLRAGFRGRMAWLVLVASSLQVVAFAIAVWTGVRFFGAQSVDDRVLWGTAMLMAWSAVAMLKLMVWGHVERGLIRRDLKQLALQIATLAERQHDRG